MPSTLLPTRASRVAVVAAAACSAVYFWFDLQFGASLATGVLYTTVVLFGLLARSRALVALFAALALALVIAGWWFGPDAGDLAPVVTINRSLILVVVAIVATVAWHYLRVQRALETALRRVAELDPLTNVLNRAGLMAALRRRQAEFLRYGTGYSIVLIDVDHFKQVNDRFGHAAGDQVLRRVAEIIKASVRDVDTVGRYGGEEFIALLPSTALDSAQATAERIRIAIAQVPIRVARAQLHVTVSAGVAQVERTIGVEELIANADSAMYEAKRRGRNRVTVYRAPVPISRSRPQ
jgi:diguanylate cyclase (GGDEF)-like protein